MHLLGGGSASWERLDGAPRRDEGHRSAKARASVTISSTISAVAPSSADVPSTTALRALSGRQLYEEREMRRASCESRSERRAACSRRSSASSTSGGAHGAGDRLWRGGWAAGGRVLRGPDGVIMAGGRGATRRGGCTAGRRVGRRGALIRRDGGERRVRRAPWTRGEGRVARKGQTCQAGRCRALLLLSHVYSRQA